MYRAVFDTNILISALLFPKGYPEKIFQAAKMGEVELFLSSFILEEFQTVCVEKFDLDLESTFRHLKRLKKIARIVYPEQRLTVIQAKKADNRILECALEARTEFLVSGDTKHLLPLKEFRGIRILSAKDFWEILSQGSNLSSHDHSRH